MEDQSKDGIAQEGDEVAPHHVNPVEREAGNFAMDMVVPGFQRKMDQIVGDMKDEEVATDALYDAEEVSMTGRPATAAQGVDLSLFKSLDPNFDAQQFLDICRECFYEVRRARTLENPTLADGELSPQLMQALQSDIQGDVASHRHHLLPALEIRSAMVVGAKVDQGKMEAIVRFHLSGGELDRDDTVQVTAGSTAVQEWDEDWALWRDPSADTSASDEAHILSAQDHGEWLVAHKGWIVTGIERVGGADPLSPDNL